MKKTSLAGRIAVGAAGVLMGLFLFLCPVDVLLKALFILFGVLILISGVPQLILAIGNMKSNKKEAIFDLITSLINVAVGVLLIFFQNWIVMVVAGVYLVLIPLIRVFTAKNKKLQFKRELFRILLGILMILVGPGGVLEIVFDVVGIGLMVIFAIYIIAAIISSQKNQPKPPQNQIPPQQ